MSGSKLFRHIGTTLLSAIGHRRRNSSEYFFGRAVGCSLLAPQPKPRDRHCTKPRETQMVPTRARFGTEGLDAAAPTLGANAGRASARLFPVRYGCVSSHS